MTTREEFNEAVDSIRENVGGYGNTKWCLREIVDYAETLEAQLKAKDELLDKLVHQAYADADYKCKALSVKLANKDEEIERLKAESKQAYIEGSKSCDDLIRFYITKIGELSK